MEKYCKEKCCIHKEEDMNRCIDLNGRNQRNHRQDVDHIHLRPYMWH